MEKVKNFIFEKKLANVELVSRFFPISELIEEIRNADLMLGQFENNPRLNRTIPHKAFEAFAMGIPYLTGRGLAIGEIGTDDVSVFFVPLADPVAIATKIKHLFTQPKLLGQVAMRTREVFEEKFASAVLAERLVKIML